MMHEYHISVTKTARYFMLGEISPETQEVWFLLHGYAQQARTFLQHFNELSHPQRCLIAPEGLNRFYAKGFGGNPVASWMTSEDRLAEISDYTAYLEQLAHTVLPNSSSAKIILLGFSQGVATATRWLQKSSIRFDHLVLYAGEIALEFRDPLPEKLRATPSTYITGNNDPLLKEGQKAEVDKLMRQLGAQVITFEGKHEIRAEALRNFTRASRLL